MQKTTTHTTTETVTRILIGVFIGGAAVSAVVALLTLQSLRTSPATTPAPLTSPPTITIVTPEHGDVASFSIPMEVTASDDSGIARVVFYKVIKHPNGEITYSLVDTDFTAPYETELDVSAELDHFSFVMVAAKAFGNDGSSTMSQHKQVSIDRCYDDNACARVYQSVPFADRFQQTVTGLQAGSSHSLSFWAKQGMTEVVRVIVTSVDGTQEYGNCEYQIDVQPPLFWHNSSCDFIPTSSTAKITLMAGSADGPYNEQYFAYFDNLELSQGQLSDPSFIIDNGSWSGIGGMITKGAPPTAIQPFSPNDLYDLNGDGMVVVTNMETDTTDEIYISFAKGWPRAPWEFFTYLGDYSFNSQYWGVDHFFGDNDVDEMGYYSPVIISIGGITDNPSEFFYEDVVMHVESDIGELDICLPDLIFEGNNVTWNGQSLWLIVDEFGNTYNTFDSPDPDDFRPDNIAKQCLCSDGTASGKCNASNRLCMGVNFQSYSCGVCGVTCPAGYSCMGGECCRKVNGVYQCDGLQIPKID